MIEIEILNVKKISNAKGGIGNIIKDNIIITKLGAAKDLALMLLNKALKFIDYSMYLRDPYPPEHRYRQEIPAQ